MNATYQRQPTAAAGRQFFCCHSYDVKNCFNTKNIDGGRKSSYKATSRDRGSLLDIFCLALSGKTTNDIRHKRKWLMLKNGRKILEYSSNKKGCSPKNSVAKQPSDLTSFWSQTTINLSGQQGVGGGVYSL